jgi:hypothetical protein
MTMPPEAEMLFDYVCRHFFDHQIFIAYESGAVVLAQPAILQHEAGRL